MLRDQYPDALLREWVTEARARSVELVSDLSEEQLRVPLLPTINPILWELCHLAYFQEYWVLRRGAGQPPARDDVDTLFDSITIAHEARWRLPVPDRGESFAYVRSVRDRVLALIDDGLDELLRYRIVYSIFHEDMHTEALTYLRQTLGYPAPALHPPTAPSREISEVRGDVSLPGGSFELGAAPNTSFCFDNEKWAHTISVAPFSIARSAVTEGEIAEFLLAGGYSRPELWSAEGWGWRQAVQAEMPLFWRREGGNIERRHFDRWIPIESRTAACHLSWYEADAWCRFAGRRLPTEAEWEMAAAYDPSTGTKRTFPWGEDAPAPGVCNMDWAGHGPASVDAHPVGDSPAGCRQMLGNVWEWTSTTFRPYPGFEADMYVDYSSTSFETRKVLRGGAWASRSRMLRNTWRDFYQPARRDVFAGFRTCAL